MSGEHIPAEGEAGMSHPKLKHLIEYHEGRLSQERRTEFQDHLVDCEQCAELLLNLGDFEDRSEPISEQQLAAARLAARRIWIEGKQTQRRAPMWLPVAACMVLVAGLLGFGVGRLASPAQFFAEPILEMSPFQIVGEPSRGDAGQHEVMVPTGSQLAFLDLHPRVAGEFKSYQMRVVNLASGEVWGQSTVSPDAWGIFRVILPLAAAPGQAMEVIIEGKQGEGWTELLRVVVVVAQDEERTGASSVPSG